MLIAANLHISVHGQKTQNEMTRLLLYFLFFFASALWRNFFNLMNSGLVSHFGSGVPIWRDERGRWERARLSLASLGEDKRPNGVESGFVIFLEAPLNPGICH